MLTQSRSTIDLGSLQEMLDASGASTKHTMGKSLAQYFTPAWFAERMTALLPCRWQCSTIFDPQCGDRALLNAAASYGYHTFGVEIDRRFQPEPAKSGTLGTKHHLTANCCDFWRLLDEFFPDLTFRCQVANPPFGLRWNVEGADSVDSTNYTFGKLIQRAGSDGVGYMIANRGTIERLGLNTHRHVWLYQTFPVGIFDANVEIGVLHFAKEHTEGATEVHHASALPDDVRRVCDRIRVPSYYPDGTEAGKVSDAFEYIRRLLAEEKRDIPPFNIYLDARSDLRTYLSIRHELTRKLTVKDVEKLARIDHCNPLTLTTERDTRILMEELVVCGTYTVQPEAKAAIEKALAECAAIACPIMPVTDFERTAYADDKEALEAASRGTSDIILTIGKRYPVTTGSYTFVNSYQRMRLHLAGNETYAAEHDLTLTGQDRFTSLVDDAGVTHRFLDRPDTNRKVPPFEHSDELLWQLFAKPEVQTVAERYPAEVAKNLAVMEACEMLAGFTYYDGQKDFYSRVAVRDYALVGAATGTGKTLGAITLVALKAPQRALIVAPQGTTRGSKGDDEDSVEDLQASQWITELRRFAPGLQVFELFSLEDYGRILNLNGGVLPHGVYVTYYEAFFSNGSRETPSEKLDDAKLARFCGLPPPPVEFEGEDGPVRRNPLEWCDGIGHEKNGIRCIAKPSLSTLIGDLFDFVALDEAHKCCHLSAGVTQKLVRLQPKYRYALTATPIPNLVTDIFPLMGWLCVPGWYRGKVCNAAFPYARGDGHRFSTTFLSTERDLTQERMNKEADDKWRGKCESVSPVISAPARLLKIIKPTMAFISKEACNPLKPKATIHDVRVPMGRAQAKLYGHYMNRANVPTKKTGLAAAMERAGKQITILRDLCAGPASSPWNSQVFARVTSNFNPKTAAILSLVRDILAKGEQVVIVSARCKHSDYLERRLTEAGIPVARIDSSRPPERHTEQANLFKSRRAPVMMMGIKCAQAHSFDLCPNLIVASLEYAFGSFEQAIGRIDRVTSKRPMHVWCVLHKNSIEEIMFDIVATKGDAATICLRGQRVPRDFKAADLGEILAQSFEQFRATTLSDQPEEMTVEAGWPQLCATLRAALAVHPCQLARNG